MGTGWMYYTQGEINIMNYNYLFFFPYSPSNNIYNSYGYNNNDNYNCVPITQVDFTLIELYVYYNL